jgi:hypothetical protein
LALMAAAWALGKPWQAGASPARFDRFGLALFLAAVALRAALGVWAPFHHNGHGTLWLSSALRPLIFSDMYGDGYFSMYGALASIYKPAYQTIVFVANILLSSVTVIAIYSLAADLSGNVRAARFVGALAALEPLSVRTAASESYLIPISALVSVVTVALLAAPRLFAARRAPSALALGLGAGLLASQASRIHPVAWLPVALALATALATWSIRGVSRRRIQSLLAVFLVAFLPGTITSVVTSLGAMFIVPPGSTPLPLHGLFRDTWWANLGVAGALTAVTAWKYGVRHPAVSVALAALLLAAASREVYSGGPLFKAGYDRLFLPFVLCGLAVVVARYTRLLVWPELPALVIAAVLTAYYGLELRANTEQLQFRTLRAWLRELPGDCIVATPWHPHLRATTPFLETRDDRHADRQALDVKSEADLERLIASKPRCAVYVQTSVCGMAEMRERCERLARLPGLVEVAREDLPARPSIREPFVVDVVRVALFRVSPSTTP